MGGLFLVPLYGNCLSHLLHVQVKSHMPVQEVTFASLETISSESKSEDLKEAVNNTGRVVLSCNNEPDLSNAADIAAQDSPQAETDQEVTTQKALWEPVWDSHYQRYYYCNTYTWETTWEVPEALEDYNSHAPWETSEQITENCEPGITEELDIGVELACAFQLVGEYALGSSETLHNFCTCSETHCGPTSGHSPEITNQVELDSTVCAEELSVLGALETNKHCNLQTAVDVDDSLPHANDVLCDVNEKVTNMAMFQAASWVGTSSTLRYAGCCRITRQLCHHASSFCLLTLFLTA